MASVMALSSVAVVASAEETNLKTKADLEKLVNETYGDSFRTDKLSEYGTYSAEKVLDALEAADAVLYDADADAEDYTVAYMMVEAVVARLVIHTAEELQALIDDCKPIVDTNNIYNEELQDLIYDAGKYEFFCGEFSNAESYVSSTSSVDITDAYDRLVAAKNDLPKNAVVSKSMFRNVIKQYESVIAAEFKYEDWRRGTIGWTNTNTGGFWVLTGGTSVTSYGTMWEVAMACNETIRAAYNSLDAIKTLSKTSDETIVAGYKMAQDAVAVFNSWTVDTSTRATKAGVNALLKEYHNVLVADYATTAAEDLYAAIASLNDTSKGNASLQTSKGTAKDFWGNDIEKTFDASWNVYLSDNAYVPVDANGYCMDTTAIVIGGAKAPTQEQLPAGAAKWQRIAKGTNFNILKLVAIDPAAVTADLDFDPVNNGALDAGSEWNKSVVGNWANDGVIMGEVTALENPWGPVASTLVGDAVAGYNGAVINLSTAYALAMDYLDGNDSFASMTNDIDTTGVVANDQPKGNAKEWAIVYRYLSYALSDKYDATPDTAKYTRADVKALIEKAYELAELTGDAAIFEVSHMNLVDARQAAIEWLKLANSDKMYKEYTESKTGADGGYISSTKAYQNLWSWYEALEKEYNAMKYSFGDIYAKMAEVAEMIDDGDLEATTELMTALDDTAYALSIMEAELDDGYDENPAFDLDRVFQAHNRLITHTDKDNKQKILLKDGSIEIACHETDINTDHYRLLTAYEALLAAITAQTAPQVLLGDVDANGTVNALDAAALLTAIVDGKALDAAVADYDKNGAVNALDAAAILNAIVNA